MNQIIRRTSLSYASIGSFTLSIYRKISLPVCPKDKRLDITTSKKENKAI